jgi:uncharacterized membrane protein
MGQASSTSEVVRKNIHCLLEVRKRHEAERSWSQRLADLVARLAGSMACVLFHTVWFGAWLLLNSGLAPGLRPFDPFPFVLLTGVVSLEAIFLTLFLLISQNRMAELADRRAELDVQINLLAEHELTTNLILLDRIAERLGVERPPQARGLEEAVDPEKLLRAIEEEERPTR